MITKQKQADALECMKLLNQAQAKFKKAFGKPLLDIALAKEQVQDIYLENKSKIKK